MNTPNQATAVIDADRDLLTMINVLTPPPGGQERLIGLLQQGMDEEIRHRPGFISSTIHRSLDNDYVVVYAQWADQQAVERVVEWIGQGGAPRMAEAFRFAEAEFHPYDVVSVHQPAEAR